MADFAAAVPPGLLNTITQAANEPGDRLVPSGDLLGKRLNISLFPILRMDGVETLSADQGILPEQIAQRESLYDNYACNEKDNCFTGHDSP